MNTFDIVFPNNNEAEFIAMAKKLGTKELLFVYSLELYKQWAEKESGVTIKTGILASQKKIKQAKAKTQYVLVAADPEKNVAIIEHEKPWLLYGFEFQTRKDFLHHRNSGINHILASLMRENNVCYGFPFSELFHLSPEEQGVVLGRLQQNMMLAKKYKVEIVVASFAHTPFEMRSVKDLWCLFLLYV